ncbi:MAG TPA: hypothetical protein VMR59_01545 [Patescibacteria group bacterium]|nr:hypothetical protein [Patescibacteria group bacterium]
MEIKNKFTTYDILICSFLLTHIEISLTEIKETTPRRFIFILTNPSLCEKLCKDFLNNATAPARELFSNREMLISEIKARNGEKYGK